MILKARTLSRFSSISPRTGPILSLTPRRSIMTYAESRFDSIAMTPLEFDSQNPVLRTTFCSSLEFQRLNPSIDINIVQECPITGVLLGEMPNNSLMAFSVDVSSTDKIMSAAKMGASKLNCRLEDIIDYVAVKNLNKDSDHFQDNSELYFELFDSLVEIQNLVPNSIQQVKIYSHERNPKLPWKIFLPQLDDRGIKYSTGVYDNRIKSYDNESRQYTNDEERSRKESITLANTGVITLHFGKQSFLQQTNPKWIPSRPTQLIKPNKDNSFHDLILPEYSKNPEEQNMTPPLYPFRTELYLRPFCKYDLNLLKESGLDEGELHKTSQTDSKFFYYVILAASDLPIGFVSFDDKEFTISYRIAEKFQNLGWGTKAAYMLVLIIFATYGETILFADIYRDNQASRRVVEKIGFTFWELRQCGAMCLRYRLQV